MTERWIYLDMDGTFVDFYGVEGWLNHLQTESVYPYKVAPALVNLNSLAKTLHKLQRNGYKVGIISWTSRGGSQSYIDAITETKRKWLKRHLRSVVFDEIHIIPYGKPKSSCRHATASYLFDDEERNREEWGADTAYDVKDLLKELRNFY